jgi:hypothetical protein
MGIFKSFPILEHVTAELRVEAFNVFNHTQFTGVNNSPGCYLQNGSNTFNAGADTCVNGNSDQGYFPSYFLHPSGVHDPRILQFAAKIKF